MSDGQKGVGEMVNAAAKAEDAAQALVESYDELASAMEPFQPSLLDQLFRRADLKQTEHYRTQRSTVEQIESRSIESIGDAEKACAAALTSVNDTRQLLTGRRMELEEDLKVAVLSFEAKMQRPEYSKTVLAVTKALGSTSLDPIRVAKASPATPEAKDVREEVAFRARWKALLSDASAVAEAHDQLKLTKQSLNRLRRYEPLLQRHIVFLRREERSWSATLQEAKLALAVEEAQRRLEALQNARDLVAIRTESLADALRIPDGEE